MMRGTISGRLRNTVLPRSKPLLPLFEAMINALQALEEAQDATEKVILIEVDRQRDVEADRLGPIEAIHITDTGIGFTDNNFESFNVVDSEYKAALGGKGLGRFMWLIAFSRVEIESHFAVASGQALQCRKFTFDAGYDEAKVQVTPSTSKRRFTKVSLMVHRDPFKSASPRTTDVLAQRIVAHFLPVFLNPKAPIITLADAGQRIDLGQYYKEHFFAASSQRAFKIADKDFQLRGYRLYATEESHHKLVYAADYREVASEQISKFIPTLKSKLEDQKGAFVYFGFVEGKYLDQHVNSDRTAFLFPSDAATDDQVAAQPDSELLSQIGQKDIREAALNVVRDELRPFLDDMNAAKDKIVTAYIMDEAPQYRPLLKIKAEFFDQIAPNSSKTEIDTVLHRQLFKKQQQLRAESQVISASVEKDESYDTYREKFLSWMRSYNELGMSALAEHVLHRKIIIEILDKALSRSEETGQHLLEEVIHNIVFPMKQSSDDVMYEQQNLWLIDERLTYHLYLTSDKPLTAAKVIETDSLDRPDILIFNNPLAFSEEEQAFSSIVLIEFKKPNRQYYSEDPVAQTFRILRKVREGRLENAKGQIVRPQSKDIPAYCYVICDITANLEQKLIDMSAQPLPDNQGYFGFNPNLNAYYEVIAYSKMLKDAKRRNRILFEKLNMPL